MRLAVNQLSQLKTFSYWAHCKFIVLISLANNSYTLNQLNNLVEQDLYKHFLSTRTVPNIVQHKRTQNVRMQTTNIMQVSYNTSGGGVYSQASNGDIPYDLIKFLLKTIYNCKTA